jgi:hypothetical protein
MTAANRLLEKILSAGDVWQDAAGRTKLLVTLDAADLETLTTFRKQATAPEDAGDERSYRVQPVSVYWLDAA